MQEGCGFESAQAADLTKAYLVYGAVLSLRLSPHIVEIVERSDFVAITFCLKPLMRQPTTHMNHLTYEKLEALTSDIRLLSVHVDEEGGI